MARTHNDFKSGEQAFLEVGLEQTNDIASCGQVQGIAENERAPRDSTAAGNERVCVRGTVKSGLYDSICRTGDDQCRTRFRTAAADVSY
jgi:hypothetical protein